MNFNNEQETSPLNKTQPSYSELLAQFEQNKILLDKQKKRAEDLRRALVQLNNELSSIKLENEHLKTGASQNQLIVQALKEAQFTIKKNELEMEQLKQDHQRLIQINETKIDGIMSKMRATEDIYRQKREEYELLANEQQSLQQKLPNLDVLYEENEQLVSECEQLKDKINMLQQSSATENEQYEQLVQENALLKERYEYILEQSSEKQVSYEEVVGQLRGQSEIAEENIEQLNQQLQKVQEQLQHSIEQNETLQLEQQLHASRSEGDFEKIAKLTQDIRIAEQSLEHAIALSAEMTKALKKAEEERDTFKSNALNLQHQLETISIECSSLEKTNDETIQQLSTLQQSLKLAEQEKVALKEALEKLEQQLTTATSENSKAQQNNEQIHEQMNILQVTCNEMQLKLKNVEAQLANKDNNKLLEKYEQKEQEFMQKVLELETIIETLKAEKEQLKNQANELLPAEIIPSFEDLEELSIFEQFEQIETELNVEELELDDIDLPEINEELEVLDSFEEAKLEDPFTEVQLSAEIELDEFDFEGEQQSETSKVQDLDMQIDEEIDSLTNVIFELEEQLAPTIVEEDLKIEENIIEKIEELKPIQKINVESKLQTEIEKIIVQEEKATINHHFRSNDDEYSHLEVVKSKLEKVQKKTPSFLSFAMSSVYEIDHKQKAEEAIKNSPYFARMDLVANKENKRYYIGKHPVNGYVIPWQSRLAKAFYELNMGESFDINSVTEGTLDYRRNIDIENGEIVYLHTPETLENEVNDAIVYRIGQKRGKEMETIVDTIQSQQYKIITLPTNQSIIVQGSAGSGKSAIALHRLSYILVNNPEIEEEKVAIISPNEAFLHHIKEVLPDLGHEDVQQFTLSQFVYILTNIQVSKNMFTYNYADELYSGRTMETKIYDELSYAPIFNEQVQVAVDSNEVIISSDVMVLFMKEIHHIPLHQKLEKVKQKIKQEINQLKNGEASSFIYLLTQKNTDVKQLLDIAELELMNKIEALYQKSLQRFMKKIVDKLTGKASNVHFERALALHIHFILNGSQPIFDYVIVDEAQDYTPYEIWILNKLCKQNNIMLVGDLAQAIQHHYSPKSWNEYGEEIGSYKIHSLTHTYRSTRQIMEEANKTILPFSKGKFEVATINPREGSDVRFEIVQREFMENNLTYWIEKYQELGYISFAFISRSPYTMQKEMPVPTISINNYAEVEGPKLIVGTPRDLKGLEFDVVFVNEVEPFAASEFEQKLKYVAYTRALHQLHIFKKYEEHSCLNVIASKR